MKKRDMELARKVLERWQAIEFFTAYTLPERQKPNKKKEWCEYLTWEEIRTSPNALPWIQGDSPKPRGNGFVYYVHLGVFSMAAVTRVLNEELPATENAFAKAADNERVPDEGYTCFAQIKVEGDGKSDISQMSISTLPWALGKLRAGNLRDLTYSNLCQDNENLAYELTGGDCEEQTAETVTVDRLDTLLRALVKWAGFKPDREVDRVYAVCIQAKPVEKKARGEKVQEPEEKLNASSSGKNKESSLGENSAAAKGQVEGADSHSDTSRGQSIYHPLPILNSFFVEDLECAIKALEHNSAGKALQQYLSNEAPTEKPDLYTAEGLQLINDLVHYSHSPLGRWPNEPAHGMALMQQFAVNVAFRDLAEGADQGGVLSVNGPPGTGKTTLLGDVVASNIVRRAEAISRFTSVKETFDSNGSVHRDLTGFEMIVASSNNTAVENISTEIPLAKKLGKVFRDLSYLKPVATMLQARLEEGQELVLPDVEERNWGLVAAVMGKQGNINAFKERFFFEKQVCEEKKSGKLLAGSFWKWHAEFRRTAPSFSEAKNNFKRALSGYKAQLRNLDEFCANNDAIVRLAEQEKELLAKQGKADVKVKELDLQLATKKEELSNLQSSKVDAEREFRAIHAHLGRAKKERSFWAPVLRFFNTRSWREYESRVEKLEAGLARQECILAGLTKRSYEANDKISKLIQERAGWRGRFVKELSDLEKKRNELQARVRIFKEKHPGMRFPKKNDRIQDGEVQRHAPWQDAIINRTRSELLKLALNLHEVWLAEATRIEQVRDRLFEISKELGRGDGVTLGHWQLLFMIVPVMSTTFASLGRMLQSIPPNSLGWLMIDEAGQAPPQEAVGGLLRARNVLVVGDPLQVEPVVTAPSVLLDKIMSYDMEPGTEKHWNPSKQSVQTLADRVNPYGCMMEGGQAPTRVGIPLWVHRRCVDPMFSIANEIAYDNRMVHGSESYEPAGDPIFSGATWFDSTKLSRPDLSDAKEKQFRPEEAVILVNLVSHLLANGRTLDDLFVITPFKAISTKLREHVVKEHKALAKSAELAKSSEDGDVPSLDVFGWANNSIGTIHTFQGRENSVVIMVLGCDEDRKGAVNWASSSPNILNVAVTRAKKYLYVIGPLELWGNQPGFNVLRQYVSVAGDPGMPLEKGSEMPLGDMRKFFSALEVEPNASPEEIKAGFRKMVRKYHPDKYESNEYSEDDKQKAKLIFEQAKEAYENLMPDVENE